MHPSPAASAQAESSCFLTTPVWLCWQPTDPIMRLPTLMVRPIGFSVPDRQEVPEWWWQIAKD